MNRDAIKKRLTSYYRIELICVVFLPATAIFVLITFRQKISLVSIYSMLVTSALLVVGGYYWRAKLSQLDRVERDLERILTWADRLQYLMLSLVAIAILLCVAGLFFLELFSSAGDRIAAVSMSTLAALEYVNYYHRQLQHFDHMPDFLRLISGRGFRRSSMSRDLERFRQKPRQ